ncbi:MAG: TlpA family protein disulfide reductase [Armatimonadetes bacterium]|nr:TlpA family protein disulfide reductase [Armatimonadota bacterium]
MLLIVTGAALLALVVLVLLDSAGLVTAPWSRETRRPPTAARPPAPGAAVRTAAGPAAPDFTLPGLEGGQVRLSQFRGRPVMLNFFAAWCAPCWKEMPVFQRAYERYQPQGLVIVGVGVQDSKDTLGGMMRLLKLTFPTAYDGDGAVAVTKYRLRGLPASFFIDGEGVLRGQWLGPMDERILERHLPLILAAR